MSYNYEIKETSEEEKENIKLRAEVLSLREINKILTKKSEGVRSRADILKAAKSSLKFAYDEYDHGKADALLWVLGYGWDTDVSVLENEIKKMSK